MTDLSTSAQRYVYRTRIIKYGLLGLSFLFIGLLIFLGIRQGVFNTLPSLDVLSNLDIEDIEITDDEAGAIIKGLSMRGVTKNNVPYHIEAERMQGNPLRETEIKLDKVYAQFEDIKGDGAEKTTLQAKRGEYYPQADRLILFSPLQIITAANYDILAGTVTLDLAQNNAQSQDEITIRYDGNHVRADHFSARFGHTERVDFAGNVQVNIIDENRQAAISADKLQAQNNHYDFRKNVKVIIQNTPTTQDRIDITAQALDMRADYLYFSNSVTLTATRTTSPPLYSFIEAEKMTIDNQATQAKFEGGVYMRTNDMELSARELTGTYTSVGMVVEHIYAKGDVFLTLLHDNRMLRAQDMHYDIAADMLYVNGAVDVAENATTDIAETRVTGERLVINLKQNRSVISAGETGRVKGVFRPGRRD